MKRVNLRKTEKLTNQTLRTSPREYRPLVIGYLAVFIGLSVFVGIDAKAVLGAAIAGAIGGERLYGAPGKLCLLSVSPVEKPRIVWYYLRTVFWAVLIIAAALIAIDLVVGAFQYGGAQYYRRFTKDIFNFEQAKGYAYYYLSCVAVLFLFAAFTFRRRMAVRLAGGAAVGVYILLCNLYVYLRIPFGYRKAIDLGITAVFDSLPNPETTLAVQALVCAGIVVGSVFSLFYSAYKKPKGAMK
ncbi:MAG: hypothetical protein QM689_09340 [Oscillospiraceae bacterium]